MEQKFCSNLAEKKMWASASMVFLSEEDAS